MTEYVERKALRDALYDADAITMDGVRIINQFPAADAAPVVHGRWSDTVTTSSRWKFVKCSVCDYREYNHTHKCNRFKYCPNCGAKMDGGDDNAAD